METRVLGPLRIRFTGPLLLLLACSSSVPALSAGDRAREKEWLHSQGEAEPGGVSETGSSARVSNPLLDELVEQGITDPEALKVAFDVAWHRRHESAGSGDGTPSTVPEDPAEHARLKTRADAEWHARRPVVSGREVPVNDSCGNASGVGDGSWPFSTVEAGRELPELVCDSWSSADAPDVWFRYTAGCTGTVTLSLCDSDFDSNLHVWNACGGTILACNEDFCGTNGFSAQVSLPVGVGEDVLIQVSGFNGQTGSGTLVVSTTCSAPANGTCATATPVGVGRTPFYTQPGAPDMPLPCSLNGGGDVWYVWTPGCDRRASFSTCADSDFDTILGIWSACGGTLLACNDDDCGIGSRITLDVEGGMPYYIQVLGYQNQSGHGGLTITADVANDACADATPITGAGSWSVCTRDANGSPGNPCQAIVSPDLWYVYTADCTSLVRFSTCGGASTYDTAIALFDGCGGNPLGCNDDYFDGTGYPCALDSRVDRYLRQGEQVWVQVTAYEGGSGSTALTVNTTCYNPPNDMCELALPLFEGTTGFSTVGATTDGPAEPGLCTSPGIGDITQVGSDIWYTYDPVASGIVTISLHGANYDTKLAVYAGGCPTAESAIACNDDWNSLQSQVTFPACSSETYTVRIGGRNADTGSGPITLSLAPVSALPAPQNLQIQVSVGEVLLSWDPVDSNALGCPLSEVLYTVLAYDANGNGGVLGTSFDTHVFLPGELQNDTTRTYRVIAGTPSAVAVSPEPVPSGGRQLSK